MTNSAQALNVQTTITVEGAMNDNKEDCALATDFLKQQQTDKNYSCKTKHKLRGL
jgi:hypothetical protein